MSKLLKGNFQTRKEVIARDKTPSLEERFEEAATKRLGGSICYVAKHKVVWGHESKKAE